MSHADTSFDWGVSFVIEYIASIKAILHGYSLANSIAAFIGITESIDKKVDRLIHSEYDSGISFLIQAKNSVTEQQTLLREARSSFSKAITLENDQRLLLSYLGLAMCHQLLHDDANCKLALENGIHTITSCEKKQEKAGKRFTTFANIPMLNDISMITWVGGFKKTDDINELKKAMKTYLNENYKNGS
jgi:hypothetical protein